MKKVLLLAIVSLICMGTMAQTDSLSFVAMKNNYYVISNVEKAEGFTKAELFKNALVWISDKYSPDQVEIQTKDVEAGLIVLKGFSKLNSTILHKLTIQLKDGKYKWEISDMYIKPKSQYIPTRSCEDRFSGEGNTPDRFGIIYSWFKTTIQSLENKMLEKDNW